MLKIGSINNTALLDARKTKENASMANSSTVQNQSYDAIPASFYRANFSPISFGVRRIRGISLNLPGSEPTQIKQAFFTTASYSERYTNLFEGLKQKSSWYGSNWGANIINGFLDGGEDRQIDTHIIMFDKNASEVDRVACLMTTKKSEVTNVLELGAIQAVPGVEDTTDIKTMAIYSLVKKAKEEGCDAIQLSTEPVNRAFYNELGFKKIPATKYLERSTYADINIEDFDKTCEMLDKSIITYYELDKKHFDSFIKRVEAQCPQD